jgi:hypothetical protein
MSFEDVIKEYVTRLDEADPALDPNLGGAPGDPMAAAGGAPEGMPPEMQQEPEEPPKEPEVKALTSEGRRFLVDLSLKALAFDPDSLSASDKALFDSEVTPENAEEVLERVQQIVDASGVESSAPTDQG